MSPHDREMSLASVYEVLLSYLYLFRNARLSTCSGSRRERRLSTSLPVARNRCSEAANNTGYREKTAATAASVGMHVHVPSTERADRI